MPRLFSARSYVIIALLAVLALVLELSLPFFALDRNVGLAAPLAAPPTRTRTPTKTLPPTQTKTPLPATKTKTPTRTLTPAPPTKTNTRLPATNTPTKTRTATKTATPAPPTSTPTQTMLPGVVLDSVWIEDGNEATVSTLNPGDSFYYAVRILNGETSSQPVSLRWQLAGPCGQIRNFTMSQTAPTGVWVRQYGDVLPTDCPGEYSFTFTMTWNGNSTALSTPLTIPGATPTPTPTNTAIPDFVGLNRVWVTDTGNVTKTVFQAGETVRFFAELVNTSSGTQTISEYWLVTGPCGSFDEISYTVNMPTGTGQMYTPAKLDNGCPGDYVYAYTLTWNGTPTTLSTTFSVQGPTSTPVPTLPPTDMATLAPTTEMTEMPLPTETPGEMIAP